MVMSALSRELVFLILQFLDEEKFKETVHKLEQESGFFFNMKYFENQVRDGNWDEAERYVSGFTKIDDNRYSMKIFFEIRKQKYFEALDKRDRAKAVEILVKDLKVFASFNEELFKELTQLLTLDNLRENEQLSKYADTKSVRAAVLIELKKTLEANPLFCDKLQFPSLRASRLRTLINQSLNWQHGICKNPRPNPVIKTLFVDHSCGKPDGAHAPSPASNTLLASVPKNGGFSLLDALQSFQPTTTAPVPSPLANWMTNKSSVTHPAGCGGATGLGSSANSVLKHPRTSPTDNLAPDHPQDDSDDISSRISDENQSQLCLPDDLPKTVSRTLNQGSTVMSMDFHPVFQTILLVGTSVGDIGLSEVGSRESLALKNFKVWDLGACSVTFQEALVEGPALSVNRVIWSPDGSLFGVAYTRHIVHIYSYHGSDDIRQHLEIDAHVGGVNDLAFSSPNKQLCIISCGDDNTIKVWDAATGAKHYTLKGHDASVYCVCPHQKSSIQFLFSTALDGKLKAWLYDNMGSRVDYVVPGQWCTTMAYSGDGSRLFSCGTSKNGESYMVEWNESEGTIRRTYQGFRTHSSSVVQFDVSKNRYLAAGDDFAIKFWDMDNVNLLTMIDAEGGLPATPRIRFNKDGTLLAVSTNENGIKILANADGIQLLRVLENCSVASASASATKIQGIPVTTIDAVTSSELTDRVAPAVAMSGAACNGDTRSLVHVKPRSTDESIDNSKIWRLTEINGRAQCRSLRLPDNLRTSKISRLIYTHSGLGILALASNAIHLLWKWPQNGRNTSVKAAASVAPQLWQPSSGILMTNDITDTNPEEAASCLALSKNDSYVVSASGGKISLFNMMTFKTMTTFMGPPPGATFLAFHPQDNNIIAIGMDDCTIQIYYVRVDEIRGRLRGHSKKITGLAFSQALNVLVSSGSDAQLCVWETGQWEMRKNKFLHVPAGRSDTHIQFHQDQKQLLVVHETLIAIYETPKLECLNQWVPQESSALVSHATFSCDGQLVYASFLDATVCVLDSASLTSQCRINPAAYLPANVSSTVYPLVIASHPSEPYQFALGMTDGGAYVLEPLESERNWGLPPPAENVLAHSLSVSPAAGGSNSDQLQR